METADGVGIFNLNALCRCCHADGHFRRLDLCYNFENGSVILIDLLRDVFGISMYSSGPEYSYSICDDCIGDLWSAAQFKTQVVNCERRFKEYCLNEQFNREAANIKDELEDDDIIKEEEIIKVETVATEDNELAHYDDNDIDAAQGGCDTQDYKEDVINEDIDAAQGGCDTQDYKEDVINEDSNKTQTKESKSEVKLKGIKRKLNVKTSEESESEIKPKKASKSEVKPTEGGKSEVKPKGKKSEIKPKERSKSEVKPKKGSKSKVKPKGNKSKVKPKERLKSEVKPKGNKSKVKPKEGIKSKVKHKQGSKSEAKPKGNKSEVKPKEGSKSEVKPKKEIITKTKKVRHDDLTDTSTICRVCCKKFTTIEDFKSHVKEAHTASLYTCKECAKTTNNFHTFKMHVSSHELKKNFCYYCDLNFPNEILRKEHGTKIHDLPSSTYICDLCKKEFLYKCSLKKHIQLNCDQRQYGLKKFMCDICGLRTADSTNLEVHKMTVHERIKRFKCESCDAKFFTNKLLKFHMFKHNGTKPAKCINCARYFLTEEGLRKHQEKFHGEQTKFHCEQTKSQKGKDLRKCKCPFCCKTFINFRSYKVHVDNHKNPHPCEVCGKIFLDKYSYNRHKLNKHTAGIDTKPFRCDVCLKKFTTKHVMLRHKESLHNPEREVKIKVKCDICKLPVADLEAHMKNHVIRPFCCKQCGKTYPAKNALNRHLLTHDENVTFDCDLCQKKFKRIRGLERHNMKIHGLKVPKKEVNNKFNVEEPYAL